MDDKNCDVAKDSDKQSQSKEMTWDEKRDKVQQQHQQRFEKEKAGLENFGAAESEEDLLQ